MGHYLNPERNLASRESKEAFLAREGTELPRPLWPDKADTALVCWVQNALFSAAAVCYERREMEAFINDGSDRPKKWYWLPKKKCYEAMGPSEAMSLREALKENE